MDYLKYLMIELIDIRGRIYLIIIAFYQESYFLFNSLKTFFQTC